MPAPARVSAAVPLQHEPAVSRRAVVQAGAVGLLGLGMNHVAALRAMAATDAAGAQRSRRPKPSSISFSPAAWRSIDSFDMKPDAPDSIRGEFRPIATRTPGIQICEHLPLLAERSHHWALVRSLAHPHPAHSAGHLLMLTGRSTCRRASTTDAAQADRLAVDRRGGRRRDPPAQ